jgi:PEP-CTERM motif
MQASQDPFTMKLRKLHCLIVVICFVAATESRAQGTFQNLGFESPTLIPIPGDPYGRVQFAPAFPGWTGTVGGVQQTAALYNNEFLDSSGISIIDHGWSSPLGLPGGVIEGNYTAVLQAGVGGDTSISQTGLVPEDAQSLQFKAFELFVPAGSFSVTLGGQTLSLMPLAIGTNYTLFGADIHALAGQMDELDFILKAQMPHVNDAYLYLDSITFSDQSIPEPSTLALLAAGASAFALRFAHRRR